MQVALYADYERDKLLKFLQDSQYIILVQAQQECQQRQLIPEMVYILERMGQIKPALQLILYGIKSVSHAIDFCKRHNDKDSWDDLIKFSLNKPGTTQIDHASINSHPNPGLFDGIRLQFFL